MTKFNIKIFITIIFIAFSMIFASFAQAHELIQLKFAKGKTTKTVSDAVLREETTTYLVNAKRGQKMSVKITSVEKNAVFTIKTPSGDFVANAGEMDDQTNWKGVLPENGNYQIEVAPTRGNTTYRMTVSVK
ncbi:MAG TPA: hypothetical protein PKY59_25185 [Pyrinomonadaceae bacterium]|nr:hypothetical protein [Pyrinomonadaceae bacterium]